MLGVKSGYKHTSLAAKDMFSTSDELKAIRNSAMDNFCLLVFKSAQVDVKRSAGLVPLYNWRPRLLVNGIVVKSMRKLIYAIRQFIRMVIYSH